MLEQVSVSYEASLAAALLQSREVVSRAAVIHRRNMVEGLVNNLKSRFPAVERLVGNEYFEAMARLYVRERPPRSPVLATYGACFPDFISVFEPACDLPYLADVARLEAARTRAYHAAEAGSVDPIRFASLAATIVPEIGLRLHPSVEIVRSRHPVVTIWAMNRGEQELAPILDWLGQDALVARPGRVVEVRTLPHGAAAFFLALGRGHKFADAAEAAFAEDARFDLTLNLAAILGSGLVRDIVIPGDH
jgi:Putative DNA-binding domain